jgi:plasmid maintenance system antidote protein VapI
LAIGHNYFAIPLDNRGRFAYSSTMLSGRQRFAEWLQRSKLSQRAAAKLLGFHWTHVNQILSGRRQPGLTNAVHIERVTGIPVEAWLPTAVGSKRERRADDDRNTLVGRR